MVKSMTGYGKAECICGNNKIIVEIRSVNGKSADISLKTQLIPRDKELEIKQLISEKLHRGNIDLFASAENIQDDAGRYINKGVFLSYYKQIETIMAEIDKHVEASEIIAAILRLPDMLDNQKREIDETEVAVGWEKLKSTISDALDQLSEYRTVEGERLQQDISERVQFILNYMNEIELFEEERILSVKERLFNRINEIIENPDNNRFEQEIIYYLEKLDITEEKVRLRQHCKYFIETLSTESFTGKKLGFIAQEMGREINTLGSKANHAEIQKRVVKMKDELEKIKEQTLNIL